VPLWPVHVVFPIFEGATLTWWPSCAKRTLYMHYGCKGVETQCAALSAELQAGHQTELYVNGHTGEYCMPYHSKAGVISGAPLLSVTKPLGDSPTRRFSDEEVVLVGAYALRVCGGEHCVLGE
jgi:hypothetical protein